jgi:eukaryotic-like serine/threonine-protein kinase
MTLVATARLGPYEIIALLGAGGMGEVYKARDTRLNRTVAIKVLPAHVRDNPDLHQRFAREAQLIAALEHPHICVLHDVSQHDGVDFLVMEYIEGETLADRLVKGPLPLEQALRYANEITDALDRAHRRGIVHRDLKPGNIMVTKLGVKLLDFGLAKFHQTAVGGTSASAAITQSTPLTDQGAILGTIQYMSPEQLEGKDADARSDIFAFGATLFEMVTGRKAFEGKSRASLMAAILEREAPPASTIRPSVPSVLDHIVGRCLAKDPDERWQSASDLTRQLEWVRRSGPQLRWWGPGAWGRWRTGALASLAGLGLFLAGLSAPRFVGSSMDPGQKVSRFVVQLPGTDPLDPSDRPAVALSPDGSRLVYVAAGRETTQLWIRPLDRFDFSALAGTEGASGPFFSPDGEWIGFFSGGKLMKISASGGLPVTLCRAPLGRGATWGEDGTILFTAAPGAGLWKVPSNGGSPEIVTRLDETQGSARTAGPSFFRTPQRRSLPSGPASTLPSTRHRFGRFRFVLAGRRVSSSAAPSPSTSPEGI